MVFAVRLEKLEEFARAFWDYVEEARVFAFYGEMAAGKTTVIEELCRIKGVQDAMGSPTFSIIRCKGNAIFLEGYFLWNSYL